MSLFWGIYADIFSNFLIFFFNFWYLCLLVVNHIQWSLISETGVCEQRNIVYISVAFFSKLKEIVWMFYLFFLLGEDDISRQKNLFLNVLDLCLLVVNHIQVLLISKTGTYEQRDIVYIFVACFSKLKDTFWMFFGVGRGETSEGIKKMVF